MSEPIVIELNNTAGDFDGTTPITLTRADFTECGKRLYQADFAGPGGLIAADLFGLFQPESLKLVGIAGISLNPYNTTKVLTSYSAGRIRSEYQLGPTMQYALMYPNDRLTLKTEDSSSTSQVTLVVNELNEQEAAEFAAAQALVVQEAGRRRFQLQRTTGTAFASSGTTWSPVWYYNHFTMKVNNQSNDTGSIPATSLGLRTLHDYVYVRVRFSGSAAGAGAVYLVDGQTGNSRVFQNSLEPLEWSKVIVLGYDDKLGLTATAANAGEILVADLDVVDVLPGDHLSGRWGAQ
jgi:hypothetical protein